MLTSDQENRLRDLAKSVVVGADIKAALDEIDRLRKNKSGAEKFLSHMIRRCQKDGRLAWIICPLSESHGLMTRAYAEMRGLDVETFTADYNKTLQFTPWPRQD